MSWYFDEVNDYATLADHAALNFPDGDWALAGHIKLTDNIGTILQYFFSWGAFAATPSLQWYIGEATNGVTEIRNKLLINGKSGNGADLAGGADRPSTANVGTSTAWQHVMLRYKKSTNTLDYVIGGVPDASWTTTGTANGIDVAGALYFGARSSASADRYFGGRLAEFARWNRWVSDAEAIALAAGDAPSLLPDSLAWYVPMLDTSNEVVNGIAVTLSGAIVDADHPVINYGSSDHLVTVADSAQANQSSAGSVSQTHLVGIANSIQANVATAAMAGQSTDSLVAVASSQQGNTASPAAIQQTHLIGIASSSQANVASAAEAGLAPVVIFADYERSSVNLAGSSVTGVGDDALIVIKPRVQESEVKSSQTAWLEPSAGVSGVIGIRPTFRFSDYAATWSDGKYHGVPWQSTRRPMFSYDDGLTWIYFDTQTVTGSYVEFRHSTPFTSNTVRISRERQVSVTQTGDWIEALAAAHPTIIAPTASAVAFAPTLTGWPALGYLADEYSAQTNELGGAIPATPLYAFEINDTSLMPANGVKRVAMIVGGVHAGEDTGNWAMMRAVEYLLSSSPAAQFVRRHFRILVYPMINAPGRVGGGWRGSYTQGTAGADDANRHFNESGSALEIVDKPKAAMHTDRAGATFAWVVDWHGQFGEPWSCFTDTQAMIDFMATLSANFGTTVTDAGDLVDAGLSEYWRINQGVPLSITLEFGNNVPITDAQYVDFGTAFVESIEDYFQYVDAASSVQANVASPAAIQQTHLVGVAGSTQANVTSAADVGHGATTFVAMADSSQANASSQAGVSQTHLVGVASSAQANAASPAAAVPTHLVGVADSAQANQAAPGSVSQAAETFVVGSTSAQPNACSGVAIQQTHLVGVANASQANAASPAAIRVTHAIAVANSAQPTVASAGSVSQSGETYVVGSQSAQPNAASTCAIQQTHLVSVANSQRPSVTSGAGIRVTHLVSVASAAQANVGSVASIDSGAPEATTLTQADIDSVVAALMTHPNMLTKKRFIGLSR